MINKDIVSFVPDFYRNAFFFFLKKYSKHFNIKDYSDFFIDCFIYFLEEKKEIEDFDLLSDKEKFVLCLRACGRYAFKIKSNKNRNYSLESNFVGCDNYNFLNILFIEDKHSLDFEMLKKLFLKLLHSYNQKQQNFLIEYMFKNKTLEFICNKYCLEPRFFKFFIFDFRYKYANLLLQNGYFENIKFLYNSEFGKKIYSKKLISGRFKQRYERSINGDIRINILAKKLSSDDICNLLNISFSHLLDIIEHRESSAKFWLYQVQKLRKNIFKSILLKVYWR